MLTCFRLLTRKKLYFPSWISFFCFCHSLSFLLPLSFTHLLSIVHYPCPTPASTLMENVRVNYIPLSLASEVCPLLSEHSITTPNCSAHNYHTQTYLTQTTTVNITFLDPTVFHTEEEPYIWQSNSTTQKFASDRSIFL